MSFYDDLETRSDDERAAELARVLPKQVEAAILSGILPPVVDPKSVTSMDDLSRLPVLRKSDLLGAQKSHMPLGGFADVSSAAYVFQSPGPLNPGHLSPWLIKPRAHGHENCGIA